MRRRLGIARAASPAGATRGRGLGLGVALALALALAGCGQKLPLPTPPPPPPIPSDQYVFAGEWAGYANVTDMLLTRHSFVSSLIVVQDSARIGAYVSKPATNTALLQTTTSVEFAPDSLVRPVHLAEAYDGTFYVADLGHRQREARLLHFSANGHTVLGQVVDRRTRLGATTIEWKTMEGVAVDSLGNIFVSGLVDSIIRNIADDVPYDTVTAQEVRRYGTDGSISVWGIRSSPSSLVATAHPTGLWATSQGLLVADAGDAGIPSRILMLSLTAPQLSVSSFGGDEGYLRKAASPAPSSVSDVTADVEGNIYFVDPPSARVLRTDPSGTVLYQLVNDPGQARNGTPLESPLHLAASIFRDPQSRLFNSTVFVADPATQRIVQYDYNH